jgi:DNA/RNA-binding domain of Phe-tRNA-synthetase-like protein
VITMLTAPEVSESARAFLAGATVAPEVFELRPDYRVLVMAAEGLEPGPPDQASEELLARAETRARTALDGRAPEDVPQVADWRDAYRAFGAKPQRTRPSVEALLRRLDAGLPRIDRLTDAYNAVSIANLVPVGGEDLEQYQGPARLVRAAGDEAFGIMAHGEPAIEHPKPGEVIWRDDSGVTCRQWNWRQCTRTRITPATINAVFIIDGLAALGHDGLTAAGDDLAGSLARLSPQAAIASRLITAGCRGHQ